MLEHDPASVLDDRIRGFGRQLVDRRTEFESVLLRARDVYARGYIAARGVANRWRYDAPPDPYRMISVDPSNVEYVRPSNAPKFRRAGRVAGGNWDRTDDRFEDLDVYRAYEQHFRDDVPWEETAFFDRIVAELDAGAERWGCSTRAQFETRCRRLDDLYETIAEKGYRTQAELRNAGGRDPIKSPHALKTERLKDEIAVHIARDGEVLFEDGRNRLSIVKVLGLDSVPVRVLCRHESWQAVRDAYVRGAPAVESHGDHPDLAGLEFGSKR